MSSASVASRTLTEFDEQEIAQEVYEVFDAEDMADQRPDFTRQEYTECIRKIMLRFPECNARQAGRGAWRSLGQNDVEYFKEIDYEKK
eukprot:84658-Hanusia_phi.AAC.1